MITNRPRRLEGVQYVGFQRYFLTICSAFKRQVFLSADTVDPAMSQLRQTATLFEFAIIAYCFMPDHVHMLVTAQSERADLPEFVRRFKQLTGFAHRQRHGEPLWQPGYHDRILRDDESTEDVTRYIMENPVRAGLAQELFEYPFAGSDVYDTAALLSAWERC